MAMDHPSIEFTTDLFDLKNSDPVPNIWKEVRAELEHARRMHPRWPTHIVAAAGIVNEEAGELIRECLNLKYDAHSDPKVTKAMRRAAIRKEAIQTAAMALRFILELDQEERSRAAKKAKINIFPTLPG